MSVWWRKKRERERSELILLAVCLVIWFSLIFRLLSLVVVTDAVSGLTTAIFTFSTPLPVPPLEYKSLGYQQNIGVYKSPASNPAMCLLMNWFWHWHRSRERHTTAVPAPNKWPTLHINTHFHAGKIQGSFIVSVSSSDTLLGFKCNVPPVQFLEIAALLSNSPSLFEGGDHSDSNAEQTG